MLQQTLIILPGWNGSHETWADFADLAKKEFAEVKVIDLPCFGDEPCPDTVWGVEDYAQFVKSKITNYFRDERDPAIAGHLPITLLGHSFGGAVATHLVANNPKIADKLVLVGAAVFRPKNYLRRAVFWLIAKLGKLIFASPLLKKGSLLVKKILYRAADSPDFSQTFGIKREIFKKIVREDQSEFLKKINCPTLAVWGAKDGYTPLRYGKKTTALISNSKLIIIPDGKHGLHLSHPQLLLQAIADYCR